VLNGEFDEAGDVLDAQLLHQAAPIGLDRLHGKKQVSAISALVFPSTTTAGLPLPPLRLARGSRIFLRPVQVRAIIWSETLGLR